MVRRKFYRKRRKFNRRRRKNIVRQRSVVPYKTVTKLPYAQDLYLSSAVGFDTSVFTLTGIYDPDISGVGHQPRGTDVYLGNDNSNTLYHHYVVLGARVSVTCSNLTDLPTRVGLCVRDSSTASPNPNDYVETSNVKLATLGPLGSGNDIRTLSMTFSAKQWFGKPNVTTERDLQGSPNSNPVEQAFLHIFHDSMGTVLTTSVIHSVKISYMVMFRNPVIQPQS